MLTVPLRERKYDLIFLVFFVINAGFVTYIVDLEQLVIANPANFTYPIWPPAPLVDLVHSYGNTYDPLLMARTPFWRMTIWIDVLFFGPFYLAAIYAFIRGLNWIRVPAVADRATGGGLATAIGAAANREVGLVVANAAYSPIGSFTTMSVDESLRALDLNCRALLVLAHQFLPAMVQRRRGGFVVMSSLAGLQGSPPISVYAATKAFGAVLAEGLWAELRGSGVDVLTCVAGAVATPGLARAMSRPAPGTLTPDEVAAAALRGLGRGPRTIPGLTIRLSAVLMSRLLARRTAIA